MNTHAAHPVTTTPPTTRTLEQQDDISTLTPASSNEDHSNKRVAAAGVGGLAESLAAGGVVVLTILALSGILTVPLLAIATIAAGAALMFEGGAVAARVSRLISLRGDTDRVDTTELEGGIAAEAMAGAAGVALGILALIGIAPVTLTAVAAIVFGGGMLLGGGARSKLNSSVIGTISGSSSVSRGGYSMRSDDSSRTSREAAFVSAGGETLVGVGALVLGILALLGIEPVTLTLVAFLALGGALLLSGTTIGARMLSVAR